MHSDNPTGIEAFSPAEMARRVQSAGVAKARLGLLPLAVLGTLGGAFIAFGALFFLVVTTGAGDGFGPVRLLGGAAFSLGLILVIVGGAELFTGNALIVMAWAGSQVTTGALLRNWVIAYAANFVGASAMVVCVALAGTLDLGGGEVGRNAVRIVEAKLALSPLNVFVRAVLCNALVCLAVWLTFAAADAAGKILAILWPISAFVAIGFEHCVANMFLLPLAVVAGAAVSAADIAENLMITTIGNVLGGAGGVAVAYWACYLRPARDKERERQAVALSALSSDHPMRVLDPADAAREGANIEDRQSALVDEAGRESFPASDAPAFNAGKIGGPSR
jgi:formate/nitrite transporter